MSRPRPDWAAPLRPPARLTREGRVALIGEAARQLVAGGTPAGHFVGGALLAWLEQGGDLPRDFFQVVVGRSHRTVQVVWRELRGGEAQNSERDPAPDTTASPPSQRNWKERER